MADAFLRRVIARRELEQGLSADPHQDAYRMRQLEEQLAHADVCARCAFCGRAVRKYREDKGLKVRSCRRQTCQNAARQRLRELAGAAMVAK